ncbi:hypothetical protein AVEN_107259-1 [Araneus ventricosus]|uniref:Uncharacterized protein n=1 Tax=Araneus ventricosus TaxID=182803 RepID=A0A4Y2LPA4_ARAVE|nr:hypothetical protein AVEN_227316-1 [Araneus ventricosus]GBN16699.1 hypothetical protein AVEN_14088-1 [Araneus ventricosus]GBN16748.1 hypothetical protein AVEN_107259-1 [Araneus ventricosus]
MDEYSASKHFEPPSFSFRITFSFLSTGTLSSGKSSSPLFSLFSRPEVKKISLHHAPASHFESRAKESQPRQPDHEWLKRAKTARISPNQNEAALSLSNGGVFALIGKKGDFKKFSAPNLSKGKGRRRISGHLERILLDNCIRTTKRPSSFLGEISVVIFEKGA